MLGNNVVHSAVCGIEERAVTEVTVQVLPRDIISVSVHCTFDVLYSLVCVKCPGACCTNASKI